jgi:hypothetical protein
MDTLDCAYSFGNAHMTMVNANRDDGFSNTANTGDAFVQVPPPTPGLDCKFAASASDRNRSVELACNLRALTDSSVCQRGHTVLGIASYLAEQGPKRLPPEAT